MDKKTYKEVYVEALDVTQVIYNLYKELAMYKIKGTIALEENMDKVNNLVDLLSDFLDKEDEFYSKVDRELNLTELGELMDYVESFGEVRPVSIDFEKLPYANSWLIPRRIINKVNNLFRHNKDNAKVVVPNEYGGFTLLSDMNEEEKIVFKENGIDVERFSEEYIQTIMLEDAFVEDHERFFLAELEKWLRSKTPVNFEQGKFYQEIAMAQMMLMFTDFVDERLMLSRRFEFSDTALCTAPIVGDNFKYIASRKDIIKSSSTIHELKYLLEDFITVAEMDVSDSRSPVVKLNRMYFEAGLKTLNEKEFNDVLATYKNLLKEITSSHMMYYSEDSIRVVRNILNKVSKEKFKFNIIKDNENQRKEAVSKGGKKFGSKVMSKYKSYKV